MSSHFYSSTNLLIGVDWLPPAWSTLSTPVGVGNAHSTLKFNFLLVHIALECVYFDPVSDSSSWFTLKLPRMSKLKT